MISMSQAVTAAVKRGRGSDSYMGTVTAIDATAAALTVDIGTGTALTGVRWISSYAPVVGDFVVVLRVGPHGWWVMGRNSKNLNTPGTVVSGEAVATSELTTSGVLDGTWTWFPYDPQTGLTQGRAGWGGVNAGLVTFPRLSDLVPAGATIVSAKTRLTRIAPAGEASSGAPLVTPALYGHMYSSAPSCVPSWVTTVCRPGSVAIGQAAQWDLPSAWLTAMLSNTLRGFALYSTAAADFSYWRPPVLTVSYTLPA